MEQEEILILTHRIYHNTSIDTHPTDSILILVGARNNMITIIGAQIASLQLVLLVVVHQLTRVFNTLCSGLRDYANNKIYLSQFYKHGTTILNLCSFDKNLLQVIELG